MQADMSYGLNLGWGGPIGNYIGFWGGPIEGCTTSLVQGSTWSPFFKGQRAMVFGGTKPGFRGLLLGKSRVLVSKEHDGDNPACHMAYRACKYTTQLPHSSSGLAG